MSAFERPSDDRDDGALAAYELQSRDCEEGATCPLISGKVQLLPLRYGLVEELEPGCSTPYTLSARPLGIRLLRNGFLYVLDGETNELAEYEFRDQGDTITGGKLEYETDRTLYVCFSEVQWTDAKRAQVQQSEADRDAFMQAVDLSGANPVSGGGEHLITTVQAEEWVAEFAEDAELEQPEGGHEQEGEAYHWENDHYYHKSRLGKLLKQHQVEDRDECLCLVVRDDIGVMRDLAMYQDNVVGWLDEWAEESDRNTERDYVLACYIESITQLNDEALDSLAEADQPPDRQSMWNDLEALEGDAQQDTRRAILDYLNDDSPLPEVGDVDLPDELQSQLQDIEDQTNRSNYYYRGGSHDYRNVIRQHQDGAIRRYYARQALQDAEPAFVDEHLGILANAKREHDQRIRDILEGARFGQRGVNDLIDRPRMDAFLVEQRRRLGRWNELLDRITSDRTDMLCLTRLHHAAWYYDAGNEAQWESAFEVVYSCTRDICRSDEASERIYDWLETHPEYDRPLFHTLPRRQQSALIEQYAAMLNAGYQVMVKTPQWLERLRDIERGNLPDVTALSEQVQAIADGAHANLSPALSIGLAQALEPLFQASGGKTLPPLEDMFRTMPRALPARLLDAAYRGKLEFRVASPQELADFSATLRRLLSLRDDLRRLNRRHNLAKSRSGHRSVEAHRLLAEKRVVQQRLAPLEESLARALSPVNEVPGSLPLIEGSAGRAGLTLVLPASQQQQVGSMVHNLRQGIAQAPRLAVVGDGLALAIFVVQAASLWNAYKALDELPNHDAGLAEHAARRVQFAGGMAATGAAGFLAAQGIGHTALSAQARALGQALSQAASQRVATQLGKLHFGLGGLGYGFGVFTAGFALHGAHGRWQEAMRRGNGRAQAAALVSMGGNTGLLGTYGYGVVRTAYTRIQIARGAATWAMAGPRLASLFVRANLIGLAVSVLEIGGSWLYNRYNLSEHDRWLQHTPWGSSPGDDSLDEYLTTLREATQPTHITLEEEIYADSLLPEWSRSPDQYRLKLTLPGVTLGGLQGPLGGPAPLRLSLKAWRVQPTKISHSTGALRAAAQWLPANDLFESLSPEEDNAGLALTGTMQAREPTTGGYSTEHLAVAIRFQRLDDNGEYTSSEQTLYIDPALGTGPENPYTPRDQARRQDTGDWQRLDSAAW